MDVQYRLHKELDALSELNVLGRQASRSVSKTMSRDLKGAEYLLRYLIECSPTLSKVSS
jgi:hypothetical protein